jgi:hypothetical protein
MKSATSTDTSFAFGRGAWRLGFAGAGEIAPIGAPAESVVFGRMGGKAERIGVGFISAPSSKHEAFWRFLLALTPYPLAGRIHLEGEGVNSMERGVYPLPLPFETKTKKCCCCGRQENRVRRQVWSYHVTHYHP